MNQTSRTCLVALAVGAIPTVASTAWAQEQPAIEQANVGDKISASLGVDFASHFVLYGQDVWGGGGDLFGGNSTMFAWAEIAVDLAPFTLTAGIWSDINDNASSPLGGEIQEVDLYVGLSYTFDRFTVGTTYQEWNYADDVERVVDLSLSYDDTGLIWEGFGFQPSLLAHLRVDGNGAQEEAEALVFGIEPSFTLTDSKDYPLSLSIPVSAAIFTDEFHGGDSGFGYFSAGATLSMPLSFIPAGYGQWSAAVNATYYHTPDDTIPGNPRENFVATTLSLGMSF